MMVSSDPVSRMKSCAPLPLMRAPDDDLVLDEAERQRVQHLAVFGIDVDGRDPVNDSRKSACARAHAAFWLRSLLGSRLM